MGYLGPFYNMSLSLPPALKLQPLPCYDLPYFSSCTLQRPHCMKTLHTLLSTVGAYVDNMEELLQFLEDQSVIVSAMQVLTFL
jgi:hypothetical protein